MDLKELCDTADPLLLTFDLGNDCTSCSQDVHRVESLVFANDGFKYAKQVCQTFLHQRMKVFQIVCKRRRRQVKMRAGQIQEQRFAFSSTDWQMYSWDSLWFRPWSVAQMVFCCVYMFVCPPGDRSQLWGSESDGVGRLSGNLHCLLLSLGDRAHRKKSAHISACPRQVPMMNARITMGFFFFVFLRTCPRHTQSSLEYCYYSHKGQMHMK